MTIRQFLTIIAFATLVCWVSWGVVVWNIDPFEASLFQMIGFYVPLFFAVSGTVATGLYGWYHFFGDVQVPVFRYVKKSATQGVSVASVVVVLFVLQGLHFLNPWTVLLLLLLTAFFVSLKFSSKHSRTV